MRYGLFDFLAEQRRFVYLAVAILSAAGIWAAFSLPSAIYPELTFPRITVVVEGSSLGARQVVFAITRPVEEAVSVVPGVTRVRSRSIRGGSEINVTFAPNTDMVYALQQVQARVNQIRSQHGPSADLDIEVERLTPSLFPVLVVQSRGRRCGDALRHRSLSDRACAVAGPRRRAGGRAGKRRARDRSHRRSGASCRDSSSRMMISRPPSDSQPLSRPLDVCRRTTDSI